MVGIGGEVWLSVGAELIVVSVVNTRLRSLDDLLSSQPLDVDGVLDDGAGEMLAVKGREIEAAVLFADIAGFSALTMPQPKCCGSYVQRGELRGFCANKGDVIYNSIQAWRDKVPRNPLKPTEVGSLDCQTRRVPITSGRLAWHWRAPNWWDSSSSSPQFREASSAWNCCCEEREKKKGKQEYSDYWSKP